MITLINKYTNKNNDKDVIKINQLINEVEILGMDWFIMGLYEIPIDIISKVYINFMAKNIIEFMKYNTYLEFRKNNMEYDISKLEKIIMDKKNREDFRIIVTKIPRNGKITKEYKHELFWKSIDNVELLNYLRCSFILNLVQVFYCNGEYIKEKGEYIKEKIEE